MVSTSGLRAPPGSWAPPPCGLATAPAGGVCGPICPLRVAFGDNERPLHSFVLLAPVERGPWPFWVLFGRGIAPRPTKVSRQRAPEQARGTRGARNGPSVSVAGLRAAFPPRDRRRRPARRLRSRDSRPLRRDRDARHGGASGQRCQPEGAPAGVRDVPSRLADQLLGGAKSARYASRCAQARNDASAATTPASGQPEKLRIRVDAFPLARGCLPDCR